jgi:hypothetical protein
MTYKCQIKALRITCCFEILILGIYQISKVGYSAWRIARTTALAARSPIRFS